MAKQKLSEVELKFKLHKPKEIDYKYQKSVSYSQFSTYLKCPHRWYLAHVKKLDPFSSNIHTIFGTAIHETLQEYFKTMYNESGAASDKMNLKEIFEEKFINLYKEEYNKTKQHFTDAEEMREFNEDAEKILTWISKRRNKLFTIRNRVLLGIEVPIIQNLKGNLFLSGLVDVILYDKDLDKVIIYDIKTSTRGWKDNDKKDITKTTQLILYKQYISQQYDIDINKIDVEYFIVKRKIYEESEFAIPRVQHFSPASGRQKQNETRSLFSKFLDDCFDDRGLPVEKEYDKIVSEISCKYCPFSNKKDLCDKNNVS